MKNKIYYYELGFIILFCFFLPLNLMAQDNDSTFFHLDKSEITSGIFYDQIYHWSKMELYDGSYEATADYEKWNQLYYETWYSALNSPSFPPIDQVRQAKKEFMKLNYGVVPIGIMNFRYHI